MRLVVRSRSSRRFGRVVLPGGSRGIAMPHAAVFVPER
jgi:hypothetical protein